MDTGKQTHLLDDLQSLLEKQTALVQQGSVHDVEALSEQAGSVVEKIANAGILESEEFKNRQEKLEKLYKDLGLTLTAKKAETAEELSRVRKGKKTVRAYHKNI